MLLSTFNSLVMFDIVFVFFLFLLGVTCLVYYLPGKQRPGAADDLELAEQDARRPLQCYVTVAATAVKEEAPVDHV